MSENIYRYDSPEHGENDVQGSDIETFVDSDSWRRAMVLLLKSYEYSQRLERPVWEFAVSIKDLCDAGLTPNDLRWLFYVGYVEYAEETMSAGKGGRTFTSSANLTFSDQTCFVLTASGLSVAQEVHQTARASGLPTRAVSSSSQNRPSDVQGPVWDPDRRELRVGGLLVKRFKVPSPNQEAILMAFQEEGWPARVDDPVPPNPRQCRKRRLLDTIKNLNRTQKNNLLKFRGDGRGEGILWEYVTKDDEGVPPDSPSG